MYNNESSSFALAPQFKARLKSFFDENFYLEFYKDIADAGVEPLQHYLKLGWAEKRRPNKWYNDKLVPPKSMDEHPGIPGYVIFLNELPGLTEEEFEEICRKSTFFELGHNNCWQCDQMRIHFDGSYYRSKYPDLRTIDNALAHYCERGWQELRDPSAKFDTRHYLETYPDVKDANLNPFIHFLTRGKFEGRKPRLLNRTKRKLLLSLVDISEAKYHYSKATPEITFRSSNDLTRVLINQLSQKKGICLSLSHDNYLKNTGGIQKFIADESDFASAAGYSYLHLVPTMVGRTIIENSHPDIFLVNCSLNGDYLGTFTAGEIVTVINELTLKFKKIRNVAVVHSMMGWSFDALLSILKQENLDVFVYGHDYFLLCPEYRLLRNNLIPCDAPPLSSHDCNICLHRNHREYHIETIKKFFEHISAKLILPSNSAKLIFESASPKIPSQIYVIPHILAEEEKTSSRVATINLHQLKKLKIAFCGEPVPHKGFLHFMELFESTRAINSLEFIHFGKSQSEFNEIKFIQTSLKSGKSTMTNHLIEHQIDVVFVGSLWRETFNYICYEAAAAGCAIICFNSSGNVADFITNYGIGAVLQDTKECQSLFESMDFNKKVSEWKNKARLLQFKSNQSIFTQGVM